MSTQQTYIDAIDQFVQGEIPLVDSDKVLAIAQAIKTHSRHNPRIVAEDVDGDGSFDYAVSGLASWSEGFSVIKQVEYPVDDDDETPDILQDDAWMMYRKPAGRVLRFLADTPSADEDLRVTYTALHTCTGLACTVDDYDEEAVQALAAGFFCDMLATYFSQDQDSTIAADSVEHSSKAKNYAARARTLKKMYYDHMGVVEGKAGAASVSHDQDKNASWGADKLTHKGRYR